MREDVEGMPNQNAEEQGLQVQRQQEIDSAVQAGISAGREVAGVSSNGTAVAEMTPEEAAITEGRVQDSAAAKVMGYASQAEEEKVVAFRGAALKEAMNQQGDHRALEKMTSHTEAAQLAREKADQQAAAAGEVYDQLKKL